MRPVSSENSIPSLPAIASRPTISARSSAFPGGASERVLAAVTPSAARSAIPRASAGTTVRGGVSSYDSRRSASASALKLSGPRARTSPSALITAIAGFKPAITVSVFLGVMTVLSSCARNEAATNAPAAAPPQVTVAQVISKPVTDFDDFTGRFEAIDRVEVRPRVSGYISSINFTEGSEVKKGDVLFVIDQRPYAAELKRAQAQLAQAKSQLSLAKSEKARAVSLLSQHAISQEEFDTRSSGDEQAQANVQLAEAALDTAELNMSFTRVTAPIAGRVSRANVTIGNLVNNGQTLLTTLVSLDPIYVRFDGDEQAYLRYTKLAKDRAAAGEKDTPNPVLVGLADEAGFPHAGVMVFEDNEIDPQTGTIRVRAKLDNHDRSFTPGLFARVRLLGERKYDALLINDSAVGTDQTVRYVLVVGADNKVEYRPVKLGPVIDGLRVVREGLKVNDTIVVNGLQRVRPGSPVTPQRVAMGEQRRHPETAMYASAGEGR